MIHRSGYNNWPPVWTTTRKGDTRPHGEVGILNHALMHESFNNRLFVRMTYEGRRYMGLLAFSDADFCRQVHSVLQSYLRRHMSEIGEIKLAHILKSSTPPIPRAPREKYAASHSRGVSALPTKRSEPA
jgi:hypothetical protein